jgi:hypothetical protein
LSTDPKLSRATRRRPKQPRGHRGRSRCAKLLALEKIGEAKLLGDLTERQRRLLAARLGPP